MPAQGCGARGVAAAPVPEHMETGTLNTYIRDGRFDDYALAMQQLTTPQQVRALPRSTQPQGLRVVCRRRCQAPSTTPP